MHTKTIIVQFPNMVMLLNRHNVNNYGVMYSRYSFNDESVIIILITVHPLLATAKDGI